MPLYRRFMMGIVRIEMNPGGLEQARALLGQRVVLAPNHPSYEPAILHWLAKRLGRPFYWLAAREVFEPWYQRVIASRAGAFSVERGARDEQSAQAARQILVDGKTWLVLFPEGQEYFLHETVLPFLPGAARRGLEAMQQMGGAADKPVYILPVALRYYFVRDMLPRIRQVLAHLERRLGLPPATRAPGSSERSWLLLRLERIGMLVLSANEELYNIDPPEDASGQQRMQTLCEAILLRSAEALGEPLPDPQQPLRNRLRKLFNAANAVINDEPSLPGDYGRALLARRQRRAEKTKAELSRVLQFVAYSADYVNEAPTVERYLDMLGRLEMEVTGRLWLYSPRAVRIIVGEPIDLSHYYSDWLQRGEAVAEEVTELLEQTVREMLQASAELTTPLPE